MADKKGIVIDTKSPSLVEHFESKFPTVPPSYPGFGIFYLITSS